MTLQRALLRRQSRTRDGRALLLRPCVTEDAAGIVRMQDEIAREPGLLTAAPGEIGELEQAMSLQLLQAQGGLAVAAEVDHALAGHLLVRRRPGKYEQHVGELAIIVSNGAQGVGVGRALMELALDWCTAVRIAKLELSVFPGNGRAIALYRRMGFIQEGTRTRAVRMPDGEHDLVLMGLAL